ncbi:hypothetical protein GCM10009105_07220 [Dokdonella soli]|uniref:Uncharacterized protein n=2 Tax=Dokdonella soli TaxID=529810 RepID=A0ABN1ID74_9GAMM
MRRFTRLTNGFSKKIQNHIHAISLHFMYYNFARIHKSLRVTPAMAAGVSDHVWSLEEIAALVPEPASTARSLQEASGGRSLIGHTLSGSMPRAPREGEERMRAYQNNQNLDDLCQQRDHAKQEVERLKAELKLAEAEVTRLDEEVSQLEQRV